MGFGLFVLLYSSAVFFLVAYMGDIGVRCMFGAELKEDVPASYSWIPERPVKKDILLEIAGVPIANYTDYTRAIRGLSDRVHQRVEVKWKNQRGQVKRAEALVGYRPPKTYLWSWVWFLQEMVIFAVGARVFWKRPHDDSARLFFWLCVMTVGAYMGGYHWTEIVVEPVMIWAFAMFAVFVPVVSLHFYLVFPRLNPVFVKYRRPVLATLYGIPSAYLSLLWGSMFWARWLGGHGGGERVLLALRLVRALALGYIGVAVVTYGICILCLITSFRFARTRAERHQVQWIALAALLSTLLIAYLLRQAWFDLSTLGRDSAAWPMFGVSLLFSVAYTLSITRYKLMQVEEIFNRSVVYFAFSVAAGLLYSCVLLVGGAIIGEQLLSANQTWRGAMVAGLSVIVVLILSELARERFQKAIDRRFHREKYKFDQAMRKMRVAVGSLVDRATLGRRLLEAAAEVLHLEWGAIYLSESPGGAFHLVASQGVTPDETQLGPGNPLVERLRVTPSIRVPHAMSLSTASDPATDAMIALGGEAAHSLGADGNLEGVLVLGPKRSGMPYEDEEIAFLGALSSVATLTLHSAGIQQTLETLNQELRDKVEKITEQQRRILILQDQLMDRGETPLQLERPAEQPQVFDSIKGSGPAVKRMIELARKVAASSSAVLIRGESGTGKEVLAEAIHASSPRASRPFVKVHCAALSQSLLESELFGHVKGAYTGADRDRIGRFEQANGGTLFLDEIGDINLEVQTKLLRVLQEMSFERVGSSQPVSVDVRILAATHQDLEALIRAGRFREDLYYRLNVIPLRTPSLRERKEDVFELAVFFLGRHAKRIGKGVTRLDEETVEALVAYDWPGNIRELENVIEHAVVLADGPAVTREDLPLDLLQPNRRRPRLGATAAAAGGGRPRKEAVAAPSSSSAASTSSSPSASTWSHPAPAPPAEDDWDAEVIAYERQRLIDALHEAHGNNSEAARLLGMPRSTLCSKLKKHGLLKKRGSF
ncbi:sigma 54-interacting transcriptional regulator [Singulisphaera sp. GP187]|uniref:sigma 54-interacting transcriptional regulator n=1 Tax=Singulisphaera sp. GP187 TaxID=1882752 RepID=UPI000940B28C|nr:sigma 54-interacting transcriptional regulator [Singulisphaera sp. GP187]